MEPRPELSVQWSAFLVLENEHGCSTDNGKQRNGGEQQDWNRRPIGVHAGQPFLNDAILSVRGCQFSLSRVLSQFCFPSLCLLSVLRHAPVT